jgi:hypothetical protein
MVAMPKERVISEIGATIQRYATGALATSE